MNNYIGIKTKKVSSISSTKKSSDIALRVKIMMAKSGD